METKRLYMHNSSDMSENPDEVCQHAEWAILETLMIHQALAQELQEVSLCGRLAKLPLSPIKLSGQQKLAQWKDAITK